jgi:hypothetical protein
MVKLNTIVWGFCGDDGLDVINELKPKLNILEWFSDHRDSSSIWDLLQGLIPNILNRSQNAVKSFEWFYQQHFSLYGVMITRRGLYFSNTPKLTNEFALSYYYFYDLLTKKNIELVIFANLPHEGPDFILYQVAKLLRVKVLMCYQNIFPNQFFVMTSLDDFGRFLTVPAIFKHHEITPEFGFNQKLLPLVSVVNQQKAEQSGRLALIKFKLRNKLSQIAKSLVKFSCLIISPQKLNVVKIAKKLAVIKLQSEYENRLSKCVVPKKFLDGVLNSSNKIVYFPLHLQPELTTSSIGGIFQDQVYAIEVLRALLGDEWIILVKENPYQNYFQRDELFFQRLSNIQNVYLVESKFPTIELIKHSTFVATITGTAGWESIKGGGKCLVFGQAWYSSLENCLTYHSALTIDQLLLFLAKENNFDCVAKSFDLLSERAGVGVVDDYYKRHVIGYNSKNNAVNVVNSLMAVINHSKTIWYKNSYES